MIPLENLVSPQVLQAVVAGVVVAAGWVVVASQNRRRDERLRRAREADIQRALLAEIRAHVVALDQKVPLPEDAARLLDLIRSGDFSPTLPHEANDRIFQAVIADIHLLPALVIDPVVLYYRLLSVMGALAGDIRRLPRRDRHKAAQMMEDYLGLTEETRDIGLRAMRVLTASLRGGEAAVEAILEDDQLAIAARLRQQLPGELAEMRGRLSPSTRASDRSGR